MKCIQFFPSKISGVGVYWVHLLKDLFIHEILSLFPKNLSETLHMVNFEHETAN